MGEVFDSYDFRHKKSRVYGIKSLPLTLLEFFYDLAQRLYVLCKIRDCLILVVALEIVTCLEYIDCDPADMVLYYGVVHYNPSGLVQS